MINVQQYRETGYVYDSLENYKDLFSFEKFKEVKDYIDYKNIKRHATYDYWCKYKNHFFEEKIHYNSYIKSDKNLNIADKLFENAHQYQLKKIEECDYQPTWVFGSSGDDDIMTEIRNGAISQFEENFVRKYYSDKGYTNFEESMRLQFYDKGCEIKLHDDGQPAQRICVFIFFLNNEWKEENGGQLILYTKDNNIIKVNPIFPNFVVLDSSINLFHEVKKVRDDMKYNIVSFYGFK